MSLSISVSVSPKPPIILMAFLNSLASISPPSSTSNWPKTASIDLPELLISFLSLSMISVSQLDAPMFPILFDWAFFWTPSLVVPIFFILITYFPENFILSNSFSKSLASKVLFSPAILLNMNLIWLCLRTFLEASSEVAAAEKALKPM